MRRHDGHEPDLTAAIEAYRAAAHAEADAHFDEQALDAQRRRILDRIEHVGQTARVLRFPAAARAVLPSGSISRRWISVAAAAGLIVGILAGQWLHILPGSSTGRPQTPRTAPSGAAQSVTIRPAIATSTADDDFLDAVDVAVRVRSISELRALDDLTFSYEPR